MRRMTLQRNAGHGSGGFTLVEILIAIGILAVGMTGVTALYAVAVDAHRQAMNKSAVAELARSVLSEVTADFTPRSFEGRAASLAESYVDLACRYKYLDQDNEYQSGRGVSAPNWPGLRCEVSIYPLPRRVWLWSYDISDMTFTPDKQELDFDTWLITNYWDPAKNAPASEAINQTLRDILAQAAEYKLVVKVIRGEGKRNLDPKFPELSQTTETETFETIILPQGVTDWQPPAKP